MSKKSRRLTRLQLIDITIIHMSKSIKINKPIRTRKIEIKIKKRTTNVTVRRDHQSRSRKNELARRWNRVQKKY